jgi:hypothetical protein
MADNNKTCLYCGSDCKRDNYRTDRTQHSHKSEHTNKLYCTNCAYYQKMIKLEIDRSGSHKNLGSKIYEQIPKRGVCVIDDDGTIGKPYYVTDDTSLQDIGQKVYNSINSDKSKYLVIGKKSIRIDPSDNEYKGNDDLESISAYKIDSDGAHKL